jgi:hypothetical protein
MAFVAALAPYLAAAGAAYQGIQQSQASQYNAAVTSQEQRNSVNQASAQEGLVRRNSREMLGRQAAAFGAAGVGYGGSSETALDQSAVNQELDALNTRYKGAITGWGYGAQSQVDQAQSKSYGLLAGAAMLKGLGPTYTFSPQSPGQAAGLNSATPSSGLGGNIPTQ